MSQGPRGEESESRKLIAWADEVEFETRLCLKTPPIDMSGMAEVSPALKSGFQIEPSALSQLNFRVDGFQFAPCVFDFHLPINASLQRVNVG